MKRRQSFISSWTIRAYCWACERLYYQLARYYDLVSWLVSGGQWRRWQRGVWSLFDGREVLELGCGTGAMLEEGTQRGKRMVGLDLSPAMLVIAAERIARSGSQLVCASGHQLPFTCGAFDTVMATFPAGYILTASTLVEVHRVLRGDGRFVIIGIGVELHAGLLARLIPIFYGRPDATLERRLTGQVAAAGFTVQWVRQRHGIVTVSGLVAEKQDENYDAKS